MELQAAWAEENPKPDTVTLTTTLPRRDHSSDEIWLRFSKLPQLPKTEPCPPPAHTWLASGDDEGGLGSANGTAAQLDVFGESDARPPVNPTSQDSSIAQSKQKITRRHTSTRQLVGEASTSAARPDGGETRQKHVSETIVNGHRAFHVAEGYYALPTCPVPDDQLHAWRALFSPRLESELLQVFRTERCQLEFLMFAGKHGSAEPGILLTCLYERATLTVREREKLRRKIQKKVSKFESLRDCLFPCRVTVDNVRLLAFAKPNHVISQEEQLMQIDCQVSDSSTTMCGTLLRILPNGTGDPVYCTLGGLLVVGGTVYGLTVRHPSVSSLGQAAETSSSVCSEIPFSELSTDSEDSDADDDVVSISRSNWLPSTLPHPPESARGNLAVSANASPGSTIIRDEQDHHTHCYSRLGTSYPLAFGNHYQKVDAMLVALANPSHIMPNEYQTPKSNQRVKITNVASQGSDSLRPNHDVCVIAGVSGIMLGILGQSGINLELGGESYCAQQIVLEKPLVPGDSGSWVVQGTKLAGYIIAGRAMFPWAYMIQITELVDLITQLSLVWSLDISRQPMPEPVQEDPDPEQFYKQISNFEPPYPDSRLAQRAEGFANKKTEKDASLFVTSGGQPKVVTPSMKKPTEGNSVEDLLNALLLEPAPLHSKQSQIRRDYPHEIALLRSEAKEAGISLKWRDRIISRQWLQSHGDELDSIF